MVQEWERGLNALMAIVISFVLLSAYYVQFVLEEEPCCLCMLQRLGMISVACGNLLNLRFGIRPSHYGLSIISALCGASVSLRQISLHVCPQFPTFGEPMMGLSLFTWAFLVFLCSIVGVALLLFFYNPERSAKKPSHLNWFEKLPFGLLFAIALANVVTTFIQCGFGPGK